MKKNVFNVSINKESEKNPVYNVLNVFLKKEPENNPVLSVFNVSTKCTKLSKYLGSGVIHIV
jgi:hypothetical protein